MPKKAVNPASKFGAGRASQHILTRPNPIKNLKPAKLASLLDNFAAGQLRETALLWQKIIERDDQVITCAGKRKRGTPGRNWEILPIDDSPAALKHKETLEAFYNGLRCTNGLDLNERGGVRLLIRQMLTAIDLKYAAHEIIWQPLPGGDYTAEFKFIPLQFFENTTGKLRFLRSDSDYTGIDLDEFFGEAGWMTTTGEGLMTAGCVAYMFKIMPLKAWIGFCEKYGTPGLHGKTDAAKGSEEWNALADALAGFGEDLALITNTGASIAPIEVANAGASPHPALVDRMDRAISRIWMGGDLSTMSQSGQAVGSDAQSGDLADLKDEDCDLITDTLNESVDRHVIRLRYGVETPLAYFRLQKPTRFNATVEIATDQFLITNGLPVGKKDLLQRYGRPEPDEDEELVTAPTPVAAPAFGFRGAVNDRAPDARFELFRAQSLRTLSQAQAAALRPLTDRLSEIVGIEDEAAQDAALLKLQNDLPGLLKTIGTDPQLLTAWENIFSAALLSGATEAAQAQAQPITAKP